jgi:GDP-L-fucose synthase
MPTNLYGPGDNFDLQASHVLPALIRKAHEAKQGSSATMTVLGTGNPRREFLFVDDMAAACLFLANLDDARYDAFLRHDPYLPLINIGFGTDLTIRELAEVVARVVGYGGSLVFDPAFPDGTPQKLLDSSRIRGLGWHPSRSLEEGIALTYQAYLRTLDRETASAGSR